MALGVLHQSGRCVVKRDTEVSLSSVNSFASADFPKNKAIFQTSRHLHFHWGALKTSTQSKVFLESDLQSLNETLGFRKKASLSICHRGRLVP